MEELEISLIQNNDSDQKSIGEISRYRLAYRKMITDCTMQIIRKSWCKLAWIFLFLLCSGCEILPTDECCCVFTDGRQDYKMSCSSEDQDKCRDKGGDVASPSATYGGACNSGANLETFPNADTVNSIRLQTSRGEIVLPIKLTSLYLAAQKNSSSENDSFSSQKDTVRGAQSMDSCKQLCLMNSPRCLKYSLLPKYVEAIKKLESRISDVQPLSITSSEIVEMFKLTPDNAAGRGPTSVTEGKLINDGEAKEIAVKESNEDGIYIDLPSSIEGTLVVRDDGLNVTLDVNKTGTLRMVNTFDNQEYGGKITNIETFKEDFYMQTENGCVKVPYSEPN